MNNTINGKKHLLILGAGASMSLVPKDHKAALPSGMQLINYIANYNKNILCYLIAKEESKSKPQEFELNYIKLKKFINNKPVVEIMNVLKGGSYSMPDDFLHGGEYAGTLQETTAMLTRQKDIGIELLKPIENVNSLLKLTCVKNMNMKKHIIKLMFVSHLVNKHMPNSIDYFANNLEFFVSRDIQEYIEASFAVDIKEAKIDLQKYLKIIICEYLAEKQRLTIGFAIENTDQNYIKQIIWNLSLEANKFNMPIKYYIEKNLDIITFNYDITTEVLLRSYQDLQINVINCTDTETSQTDSEIINVLHVYSYLGANNETSNHANFDIATILLPDDQDDAKFVKHIEICDKSIFWIRNLVGSSDSEQTKMSTKVLCQKLIKDATNIYILGFGFDKNNLDNIGFTDIGTEALSKKAFFISKSSSKSISTFMEHVLVANIKKNNTPIQSVEKIVQEYKLANRYGDSQVFYAMYNGWSNKLLFSMNDINTAFIHDFDI